VPTVDIHRHDAWAYGRAKSGSVLLTAAAVAVDLLVWSGDRLLRTGGTLPLWIVPTLTAVVYAALLVRWHHPVAVFVLQWAYALAGLIVPGYEPFAGLLIALHAVARQRSISLASVVLAACGLPFIIDSYNSAMTAAEGDPWANFAAAAALWTALSLTVWGLGRLAFVAERRAEQLRHVQAAEAVQAERQRLARELHDIVAHGVSAMILQAAGARTLLAPRDRRVRQTLEVIETAGVQAMGELHRLLGLLRATSSEDAGDRYEQPPTLQDIDKLVALSHASGVDVSTVVDGRPSELDRSVDLAVYRVAQEALTNTFKHAGRGASARIHLIWGDESLTVAVRSCGGLKHPSGRPKLSSGYGLTGLAERVTLVGGRLETGPVSGGFLVRAEFPTQRNRSADRTADRLPKGER
jgi:signal transduction histidine kinase